MLNRKDKAEFFRILKTVKAKFRFKSEFDDEGWGEIDEALPHNIKQYEKDSKDFFAEFAKLDDDYAAYLIEQLVSAKRALLVKAAKKKGFDKK